MSDLETHAAAAEPPPAPQPPVSVDERPVGLGALQFQAEVSGEEGQVHARAVQLAAGRPAQVEDAVDEVRHAGAGKADLG